MSGALRLFTFCLIATVSFPSTAHAQRGNQRSLEDSLKSAEYYAACVVRKRRDMARAAIMDDEHYIQKKYPKLIDPSCLQHRYNSKLFFPDDTLHEIFSTALVRAEFAETGPVDFSTVPPLPEITARFATEAELAAMSRKKREELVEREKTARSWIFLRKIGECTARRAPEKIRLLARTPVTSNDEKIKMNELLPDIQECTPANTTFRIQRSNLRGPLVRSYYTLARLSVTQPPAMEAK